MAMYGTPGGITSILPISPAADHHPPVDRVLMDVRKGFQDYQANAGQLYGVGQNLMRKYGLAYLRIESRGGVSIHRSYDPDRISYENVQKIERAAAGLAVTPNQTEPTPLRSGRYYIQEHHIQVLKGAESVEAATVTLAYEQIYIGAKRFANLFGVPHAISRLFYVRFDETAPFIAGTLIVFGLALTLIALRNVPLLRARIPRARRIVFAEETWPDPNRPLTGASGDDARSRLDLRVAEPAHETDAPEESEEIEASDKTEQTVRILSDPANFIFDAPLSPEENQSLRKKIQLLEHEQLHIDRYEFEQERWNLPGFQSVMRPLRRGISADDVDFFAHRGRGRGFDNQSSLFDFRYYRFHDQPGFPEQIADIESFAKGFLTAVTDLAGHATVTLFLRNRRGQYHATLRRTGSIFISGATLGSEPVAAHLVKQLEEGRYVVMEDGYEIYFPVPSRQGVLGLLRLKSDRPLYNSETLSRVWYEIRKFGESLFQARVYDEAVSDPESTLYNGLTFHRDLLHEFALKREVKTARMLVLLRFRGRSNRESVQLFGLGLRSFFANPFRLYRIAADVFAALGPELPADELERRLGEFLTYVREQEPVDANVGGAVLSDDGTGPGSAYEWFRQAALALEQCEKIGLNRLRFYESAHGEPVAFRRYVNQD